MQINEIAVRRWRHVSGLGYVGYCGDERGSRSACGEARAVREESGMNSRALIICLTLVSSHAAAMDAGCKANPDLIGRCYIAHGRVFSAADIGFVLSVRNQGKITFWDIRPAPNSEMAMPGNLSKALTSPYANIQGSYEICPVPNQISRFGFAAGDHYACIESASELSARQAPDEMQNSK
jgi:hypothetical protein